ncbi:hypothetical protein [Sphingobacterium hungaricum]
MVSPKKSMITTSKDFEEINPDFYKKNSEDGNLSLEFEYLVNLFLKKNKYTSNLKKSEKISFRKIDNRDYLLYLNQIKLNTDLFEKLALKELKEYTDKYPNLDSQSFLQHFQYDLHTIKFTEFITEEQKQQNQEVEKIYDNLVRSLKWSQSEASRKGGDKFQIRLGVECLARSYGFFSNTIKQYITRICCIILNCNANGNYQIHFYTDRKIHNMLEQDLIKSLLRDISFSVSDDLDKILFLHLNSNCYNLYNKFLQLSVTDPNHTIQITKPPTVFSEWLRYTFNIKNI